MAYEVYTQDDGDKKVIVLEEDNGRAYVSSNTFDKVSDKSRGRFDEEDELVDNWFGISRWNAGTLDDKATFDREFDSLAKAIKYVKNYNNGTTESVVKKPILNTNNNTMTNNVNILNKFEAEEFFTKENLAKASATRKSVIEKRASIQRVVDLLAKVDYKLAQVENCINSSFNSAEVVSAQKSLEKAQKVIEAFETDEQLSYQATLGKTKLESEVEAFDAKAFLAD